MELLSDGWTENNTAEVLGVSVRSTERWEVNLEVKGEVNPRSVLRRRLRILDPAVMEDLLALIAESPTLYLDEIVDYLSVIHNIHISRTALHNNLQALGLTYKRMQRTASQRDEEAHQAWREDITTNFSCDQLVFTDESSKDGCTLYRRSGRSKTSCSSVLVPDSSSCFLVNNPHSPCLTMDRNENYHHHRPRHHWTVPRSSPESSLSILGRTSPFA